MGKIFHVKRQKSNRRSPRARKQSRSPAALSTAAIIPNKGGGRLSPIVQDLTEDLYRADNVSHFFLKMSAMAILATLKTAQR